LIHSPLLFFKKIKKEREKERKKKGKSEGRKKKERKKEKGRTAGSFSRSSLAAMPFPAHTVNCSGAELIFLCC
jgi:hypothetical protein